MVKIHHMCKLKYQGILIVWTSLLICLPILCKLLNMYQYYLSKLSYLKSCGTKKIHFEGLNSCGLHAKTKPFKFLFGSSDSFRYLADPGKARGCSTNTIVTYQVSDGSFVKISLRRRHAQTMRDGAFRYQIDCINKF